MPRFSCFHWRLNQWLFHNVMHDQVTTCWWPTSIKGVCMCDLIYLEPSIIFWMSTLFPGWYWSEKGHLFSSYHGAVFNKKKDAVLFVYILVVFCCLLSDPNWSVVVLELTESVSVSWDEELLVVIWIWLTLARLIR